MGMTTRVRGRLRSLHKLYRFDPKVREERIAETVCLLSVLFLLPYCSRGHAPLLLSLGGWCLATYSCLVLPVVVSANYKYPAKWLKKLVANIPHFARKIAIPIWNIIRKIYAPLDRCEKFFMKMAHLSNMLNQLFFLALCEVAIVRSKHSDTPRKEEKMISGLTTLLFYSVVGYFVSRVREIYVNEIQQRGPTPRHSHRSTYREYGYWICKIAIEWAKTIVIVVCLREQGLNYRPDVFYNVVTFIYYVCTERITTESIEALVTLAGFSIFDSMEYLFVPIVLKSITALFSIVLIGSLLSTPYGKYALLSSYFLLYLNLKDLFRNYVYPLIVEKRTYASFRMASNNDLETWDDICAVCLNKMSKARITPCNHLFHPQCLKRCLKNSLQCPLCKQNFIQTN